MANCWQISGGTLQGQRITTFTGNCGATLPPLDFKLAANANYQRATLALVVFPDIDSLARLIHQMTGRPGVPTRVSTILTVNKSYLPMAVSSVYKFFLKASALRANPRHRWQISSIAVKASP